MHVHRQPWCLLKLWKLTVKLWNITWLHHTAYTPGELKCGFQRKHLRYFRFAAKGAMTRKGNIFNLILLDSGIDQESVPQFLRTTTLEIDLTVPMTCDPSLLSDNNHVTSCSSQIFFSNSPLWRVGLFSGKVCFIVVIHIWGEKKEHLHCMTNRNLWYWFPWLACLIYIYIFSISVVVLRPWEQIWEILWHSQKDLPVLLTAYLTLSVVHNGFPSFKATNIYCF